MQNGTINLEDYIKSDWKIVLNDRVIARFTIPEGGKLIIGRSPDADVVIDNTAISRHHSSLELRDGRHYIADMNSTNGTTVNGKKITSKVPITEKDVVFIGKFRLTQSADETQDESSSYSTSMDIDEATVFVSSTKQQNKIGVDASAARPQNSTEAFSLTVIEGDSSARSLSLEGKTSIKIGKDPSCDLIIPGFFVSKAQCYIIKKKDKYHVIPQRSWVSTKLNDVSISEERLLRRGDIIQVKRTKIRFG